MIEGSYRSWDLYTTGLRVDGLQQEKKTGHLGLRNTQTSSLQMVKTSLKESLIYDTKQYDGETPVIREICGMRGTPSLLSLPGPLCSRVVTFDRVLSLGQIKMFHI